MMLRFTYTDNNQSPFGTIRTALGGNPAMQLGQFQQGSLLYGEIDTDPQNQSVVEEAMAPWNPTFLTQEQALAYLDTLSPLPDAVVQKKIVQNAASVMAGTPWAIKDTREIDS